jgi:UDP-2,4-diacetamido-2,4,6-trideoxy-beta-L-altropyranose hydrolase
VNFYFRISLNAGLGHLFRCINIAKELKKKNINSTFIVEKSSLKLNKFIKKNVKNVYFINRNLKSKDELNQFKKLFKLSKKKIFFLMDGYNFNYSYQKEIKKKVYKLIIISDNPNARYCCDILINPSLQDNTQKYKKLVQKNTKIYSGKKYILINNYDKKINSEIRRKRNKFTKIKKVFISFGGNSNLKLIFLSLNALFLSKFKNLKIYITVNKNTKITLTKKLKSKFKIILLKEVYNLNSYYKSCDLAIGSCGHSTWERSINMIPSICINLAKNQNLISNLLIKTKSAFVFKSKNVGLFEEFIINKMNSFQEKNIYLNYSNNISCLIQKKPLSNLVNKVLKNQ